MSTLIHEPQEKADACIIWMHGLGSNAQDMMGLAHALRLKNAVRHVSLQAPIQRVTVNNGMMMPAWYDITGVKLTDREDSAGICKSEAVIREVIASEIKKGIAPEHIFLAGFSQGGAMALFTGLQLSQPLGGLIVLSAYLPMALQCDIRLDIKTPIFMALGEYDPIVLPGWTRQAALLLKDKGFISVSLNTYSMEHAVCAEEISDLSFWLTTQLKRKESEE